MAEAEAAKVVPRYAHIPAIVARNLAANLFRDRNRLSNGITAKEERPVGQAAAPVGGRSGQRRFCHVGLLDEPAVLVPANLAAFDNAEAFRSVLVDCFQLVLERAESGRPADAVVIIVGIGRNVALLHDVDNGLDVARAHGHTVGGRGCAVGGQGDSGSAGASGRGHAQRSGCELQSRHVVQRFLGVFLQDFVDDLFHRLLGQVVQLASIRDAQAMLGDGQRALRHRIGAFVHGIALVQRAVGRYASRGSNLGIHVPMESRALVHRALLLGVFDVAKLAKAEAGLQRGSQFFAQVQAGQIAALVGP